MINFTDDEIALFNYINELMGDKEEIEFDFNDPKQFDFATMLTKKSFDTKLYPGKLQALNAQKKQHLSEGFQARVNDSSNPFSTNFTIASIGLSPTSNTVESNGLGTVVGGFGNMNLTLLVMDNITQTFVANGSSQGFGNTVLGVQTAPGGQGSSSINVTSYLQYSYTSAQTKVQSSGMVKRSTNNGSTGDPTVSAPVVTRNNPTQKSSIAIGLNRPVFSQGGNSDLDYCYYDSNPVNQPLGRIPFVGSVSFGQAIRPLQQGTTIQLTINVTNTSSGGALTTLQVSNLNQVYSAFSLSSDSKTLLWNLPPPQSQTNLGQPIMFQNITWPSDLQALFYCNIAVILQDGTPGFATIQSQYTGDNNPLDGMLSIKPISFIWHCLGEDTVITMADGSEKPIAEVNSGDEVAIGAYGEKATVIWTTKGAHFGNVLSITTTDKKKIITSHNHIFITESGAVPADKLKKGDELSTLNGKTAIAEIEIISDYEGTFYNLATGEDLDASEFDGKIDTFVANGFVVGDMNAQRAIQHKQRNDINWVKTLLPDYLHADAETYFKQKQSEKK